MGFLQMREGWKESIKESAYHQMTETKLKALSIAVRLKNPDKRFEEVKTYGVELQVNNKKILKILTNNLFNNFILLFIE